MLSCPLQLQYEAWETEGKKTLKNIFFFSDSDSVALIRQQTAKVTLPEHNVKCRRVLEKPWFCMIVTPVQCAMYTDDLNVIKSLNGALWVIIASIIMLGHLAAVINITANIWWCNLKLIYTSSCHYPLLFLYFNSLHNIFRYHNLVFVPKPNHKCVFFVPEPNNIVAHNDLLRLLACGASTYRFICGGDNNR